MMQDEQEKALPHHPAASATELADRRHRSFVPEPTSNPTELWRVPAPAVTELHQRCPTSQKKMRGCFRVLDSPAKN